MTPTLHGRWQTRLLLNLTVGVIITALIGLVRRDFQSAFVVLGYILVFGLVWDVVYIRLQAWRWDHDWPPVLYLAGAIWELIFLILMTQIAELPGIHAGYGIFWQTLQYTLIGLGSFLVMFGPMRVLFPRWRFHGGQWL